VASPDYVIAGAGIIGLSLALELDRRGASVVVLEAGRAMAQTSTAAAGMLAVEDPLNPPALRPLSELSGSLYPAFLDRIADLSGMRVPFQTTATLEQDGESTFDAHSLVPGLAATAPRFGLLNECSVDPRELAPALLAAVRATRIELREQTPLMRVQVGEDQVRVGTTGDSVEAAFLIDCMASWSPSPVFPRKGQMLAVQLPEGLDLVVTIRTPEVYIVPRTVGPNAGRAIIGATIEDVGFDLTVHGLDILTLNTRATRLLPGLAEAEFIESWAGLRPATADGLPMLGALASKKRYVLGTGHFRNGILLAPGTAQVLADLLTDETPAIDLTPFLPGRF
jgi:glycine oxidase